MIFLSLLLCLSKALGIEDETYEEKRVRERLKQGDGQQDGGFGIDVAKAQLRGEDIDNQRMEDGDDDFDMNMDSEFKCDKPHTVRDANGMCMCETGYTSTDVWELGCWKCNQTCHKSALCAQDGNCICVSGYKGDGVTNCEVIKPVIIDIQPRKCTTPMCMINVTYQYMERTSPVGYCKFNNVMVMAELLTETSMMCRVPNIQERTTEVRISFDSWSFSESYATLQMFAKSNLDSEKSVVIFLGFSLVFTAAALIYKRIFRKKKYVARHNDHERLVPKGGSML